MILDWFFPARCLACRKFHKHGLCPTCRSQWPALEPPYCPGCSFPFVSREGDSHLCGQCLSEERRCRRVSAAGLYRGLLHDLIVRLKYRKEERLAGFLGDRMAERILEGGPYDLILPIPLHIKRLRERGFNQSLLLARQVGRRTGVPVDPFLLEKGRPTPPQAELKVDERRKNLKGAFELRDPEKVKNKKILIVDDVYTTGATVETAARLLLKAGAEEVEALVLARAE